LPYACVYRSRSRSGPAWTCIEDLRVRTSSAVAARSAHTASTLIPRVRHQGWSWLWTPPQERRGLCQAPDTRMWLNARKVEGETSSDLFSPASTPGWKGRVSSFPTRYPEPIPNLLNPTRGTRPSGPLDRPDLESRSVGDLRYRSRVRSRSIDKIAPFRLRWNVPDIRRVDWMVGTWPHLGASRHISSAHLLGTHGD
jgi:hypothetical protein